MLVIESIWWFIFPLDSLGGIKDLNRSDVLGNSLEILVNFLFNFEITVKGVVTVIYPTLHLRLFLFPLSFQASSKQLKFGL